MRLLSRRTFLRRSGAAAAGLALAAGAGRSAAAPSDEPAVGVKSWPMFRGNPALTGVAPADALPDKLEPLWEYKTDQHIEGSAAVVDAVAFVGTDNVQDGMLHAVDLKTGKPLWTYKTGDPIKSTPAVAGGRVFLGDDGGVLYCVDAKTGKLVWQVKTEDKIPGSPVLVGRHVLVGSYDSNLYAVNAADGRQAWKFATDNQPINCTPAVAGTLAFISGCDQFLRVVDTQTGKETAQVNMDGQAGASPAVVGDRAYVGTFSNQFLCIDYKKREIVWAYKHDDREFPFYSSAAVADDRAVVGGRDKFVHCVNRTDGKPLWRFPTRAKVDSSPVIVGQRVFVGSHDGNVYGLDLATGKQVWSFAAGSAVAASPAVAEGRLVIGSDDGVLFCFGRK